MCTFKMYIYHLYNILFFFPLQALEYFDFDAPAENHPLYIMCQKLIKDACSSQIKYAGDVDWSACSYGYLCPQIDVYVNVYLQNGMCV